MESKFLNLEELRDWANQFKPEELENQLGLIVLKLAKLQNSMGETEDIYKMSELFAKMGALTEYSEREGL